MRRVPCTPPAIRLLNAVGIAGSMFIAAGCGGGSSSSFAPEPVTSASPAPVAAPAPAPAPATTFTTCARDGRFVEGQYAFANNIWGVGANWDPVPNYSQCATVRKVADTLAADLTWSFATGQGRVKTFPHLSHGWDDNTARSANPAFPLSLATRRSVFADFAITGVPTGTYNAAFDIWISSSTRPSPATYTHEILLYLHGRDTFPAGTPKETVKIGGQEFDFYDGSVNTGTWRFVVFFPKAPILSGRFDLADFLDFMVSRGVLTRTGYLSTIHLGYEIVDGQSAGSIGTFRITTP